MSYTIVKDWTRPYFMNRSQDSKYSIRSYRWRVSPKQKSHQWVLGYQNLQLRNPLLLNMTLQNSLLRKSSLWSTLDEIHIYKIWFAHLNLLLQCPAHQETLLRITPLKSLLSKVCRFKLRSCWNHLALTSPSKFSSSKTAPCDPLFPNLYFKNSPF